MARFKELVAGLVVASGALSASAASVYGFKNITTNGNANAQNGSSYSMTVTDEGSSGGFNFVSFLFENAVAGNPNPDSSITGIWFYDGALLDATMSVTSSAGVSITGPAGGGPLPGGSAYGLPNTEWDFKASSSGSPGGVNPGEWVKVTFQLKIGKDFNDVISSLTSGLTMPFTPGVDLVVGIHVQSLNDGQSNSFVNTALIPLPPAAWMGLAGLLGVGVFRRRLVKVRG